MDRPPHRLRHVDLARYLRRPAEGVTYRHYPKLLDMAKTVNTLIVMVPGGASTAKMVNAEVLGALGPHGVVINMSRGSVIDEQALIDALKSGIIRHAGLDVFHSEPLDAKSPLAQLPNVTLTSHAAFRTIEASQTLLRRAIDIVKSITG